MNFNIKQFGDNAMSPEMLQVAEILATPGRGGMSLEEIAAMVSISPRTLHRWRQESAVMEHIRKRSLEHVTEAMPDVLSQLVSQARSGRSIKSIEIFARIAGLMNPEVIVKPAVQDERSDEAIMADIERLRAKMEADHGNRIDMEELT